MGSRDTCRSVRVGAWRRRRSCVHATSTTSVHSRQRKSHGWVTSTGTRLRDPRSFIIGHWRAKQGGTPPSFIPHGRRSPSVRAKVALITGVTGQDGSYLARLLLQNGYIVHGIKRRSSSINTGRVDELYVDPHEGVTRSEERRV